MNRKEKKKIKIALKISAVVIAVSLLIFAGFLVNRFFLGSGLFSLEKIEVNLDKSQLGGFSSLDSIKGIKGESLFFINTHKIISELEKKYPQYKQFILQKKFPHILNIKFIERKPLFQLNIGVYYYLLDKENIVISEPKREPYDGFVIVNTFIPKGLTASIGRELDLPYSDYINSLIEILRKKGFIQKYKVTHVYAFNPSGIKFDLEGVEIKLGDGNFREKLEVLDDSIIPRFRSDLSNIAYIDLRFQDYVVGYRK